MRFWCRFFSPKFLKEGQNPVVILSLGSHERRKLCLGERSFLKFGDIIELIPGSYSYMYVKVDNECKILETEKGMGKRMCDDRIENVKRNRQIAEDEAFARCLQVCWYIYLKTLLRFARCATT